MFIVLSGNMHLHLLVRHNKSVIPVFVSIRINTRCNKVNIEPHSTLNRCCVIFVNVNVHVADPLHTGPHVKELNGRES